MPELRIYGSSDDLIEMDGYLSGEAGHFFGDEDDNPVLVVFSDGTILAVTYGKPGLGGVWGVSLVNQGVFFDRIEQCVDENADIYSDIAYFKDGIRKVWVCHEWERME